jgi:hypothetical protein
MVFLVRRIWRDLSSPSVSGSTLGPGEGTGEGLDSNKDENDNELSAVTREPKNHPNHSSLLLFGTLEQEQKHSRDDSQMLYTLRLKEVIQSQIERVWNELSEKTLKVEEKAAAGYLERTLLDLLDLDVDGPDQSQRQLYKAAWDTLSNGIRERAKNSPGLVSSVLSVFLSSKRKGREGHKEVLEESARELLKDILEKTIEECEGYVNLDEGAIENGNAKEENGEESIRVLVAFIQTFGAPLFVESDLTQVSVISHPDTLL